MERLPYFLSQLQQFSWARVESDGTFNHRIFEAGLGVYGAGVKFGFWSVPASPASHDDQSDASMSMTVLPPEGYLHGEMMLGKEWPTEAQAWKLGHKSNLIPRLFFTKELLPPQRVRPGQIKDWRSWHDWRGLSMESPVAMLMHYPLSVYHLLNILQVVDHRATSTERQAIQVHYIGTEKELNFLPL
jgi:hypothetical protein